MLLCSRQDMLTFGNSSTTPHVLENDGVQSTEYRVQSVSSMRMVDKACTRSYLGVDVVVAENEGGQASIDF